MHRDALRSTPSATRQSSASCPPPTRADTFASSGPSSPSRTCVVVGPCSIAERGRRSGRGLDRGADLRRLELGGPDVRERDAERGRGCLLAVGDRQRHEAAVEGERVDRHDAAADELLDEAVVAARLGERVRRRARERVAVGREPDAAFAGAVGRLDHDGEAELLGGRCDLGERPADARARLRDSGRREALALALPRDGELRRLRRQRMRKAEPLGDPGGDRDGVVGAGGDMPSTSSARASRSIAGSSSIETIARRSA